MILDDISNADLMVGLFCALCFWGGWIAHGALK